MCHTSRYELDLGGTREVIGVITKGRASFAQKSQEWVTRYRVQYTTDSRHSVRQNWTDVTGDLSSSGRPEIFRGNNDADSEFENVFPMPVKARYIRIYPVHWQKHIALRCGAICANQLISKPASRTASPASPAEPVDDGVASPLGAGESQHSHLVSLLLSDPKQLIGVDVEVYSVSAEQWMKGRILGIHDVSTGQVRVQYYVSARVCHHGVGGQREKVVSIKDPKLLRESEGTMELSKPYVAEPRGARAKVSEQPGGVQQDYVLMNSAQCPQVMVDVSYSVDPDTNSDVYNIAISVGSSTVHSIKGE